MKKIRLFLFVIFYNNCTLMSYALNNDFANIPELIQISNQANQRENQEINRGPIITAVASTMEKYCKSIDYLQSRNFITFLCLYELYHSTNVGNTIYYMFFIIRDLYNYNYFFSKNIHEFCFGFFRKKIENYNEFVRNILIFFFYYIAIIGMEYNDNFFNKDLSFFLLCGYNISFFDKNMHYIFIPFALSALAI